MRHHVTSLLAVFILLTLAPMTRAQWTSSFDYVNVAGDFNGFETLTPNMTLVSNGVWQHYAVVTNATQFQFLFATELFTNTWKETDQSDYETPLNGIAEFNEGGAADIVVSNAADRTYRITLNENTGAYVVQEAAAAPQQNVWINEIDYDNVGSDSNEWIELAGNAGISLDDYEILLIGDNGSTNGTFDLAPAAFTFSGENSPVGYFVFGIVPPDFGVAADYTPTNWTSNEIQNGPNDSIQLRLKSSGANVHLIDYEGDNATTTEDQIAPADSNTDPNRTVYLVGTNGLNFSDFAWVNSPSVPTPGAANQGQSIDQATSSSVTFSNTMVLPPEPVGEVPVNLQVDVYAQSGATNLTVTAFYRVPPMATFLPLPMAATGTTYTTTEPIPSHPGGVEVEYYYFVRFDGSGVGSPSQFPAGGASNPSSFPHPRLANGAVWINEMNAEPLFGSDTNEFIELAGPAGSDISGWSIELYGSTTNAYATYAAPATSVLNNAQSGYGFFLLGDSGISTVDLSFTHPPSGASHLTANGAIRLLNELGIPQYSLTYGESPPSLLFPDYAYIGGEGFFASNDEYLALTGSGSNYTDFAWTTNTVGSAGAGNAGQTLVGGTTVGPAPMVSIVAISRSGTNVEIQSTGTNTWTVVPEYTTDLTGSNPVWTAISTFSNTFDNGINTTTFEQPVTPAPVLHYRIRQTGAGGPAAPSVTIVSVSRTGSDFEVVSTGSDAWTLVPEYSTGLIAGEWQWAPITPFSNTYLNGTNTTTFAEPSSPMPVTHLRIRQTFP